MTGLLRRLKRSRAAGAGEVPPAGHDATKDDAPTPPATADAARPSLFADPDAPVRPPAAGAAAAPVAPVPRQDGSDEPVRLPAPAEPAPAAAPGLGTPAAPPPDLARDPAVPAGLAAGEAVERPTGRRGKLRRRLRYLRRARELMLRDLGGLVYEVHRTGGGDIPAHAALLHAKVQRLAALDAEAHALEGALSAPREQAVLFEPGIGGTCDVCGELYGSDARFCAQCGASTSGVPAAEAEPAPASERAPTLAGPAAPAPAPSPPEPPPDRPAPGAEAATSRLAAVNIDQPTSEMSPVAAPADDRGQARDDGPAATARDDDQPIAARNDDQPATAGDDDPSPTAHDDALAARERGA